jgi:hypothetical protein
MCLGKPRKAKVYSETKISGILPILRSGTNALRYALTRETKERVW